MRRRPGAAGLTQERSARLLWGVMLHSPRDKMPRLLWRAWYDGATVAYPGEPNRPIVFSTRAAARAWCRAQHDKYRNRNDICAQWRFNAVRVREQHVTR